MKRFAKASEIKVGVVGYGGAFNMGREHLKQCMHAGMTPTAVADPDASRLEVAAREYPGIGTYLTLESLLKKSKANLIILITPHNTHAKLALKALSAGRHVVSEKPLAITTVECDAMMAMARRKGVALSTYHNRHWDGCIMNAVKLVKSGVIGKVVRVEATMGAWGNPGDWWRSSKTVSGGILYDWGVHLLEYLFQVIDAPMSEVNAFTHTGFWAKQTKWKNDTNEDEGFVTIRFKGGQWATLRITNIDSRPKDGMFEITGTKGSIWFDMRGFQVTTHDGKDTLVRKGVNPPHACARYYQNIADHLVKGRPLVITAEWSRRPIHVLDLAGQSARTGRALKPKYC